MSVSLMLLPVLTQAAGAVVPLAETGAVTVIPQAGQGLNYWHLIMEASLPVKAVMLLLVFASVASWTIIFRKQKVLSTALEESENFEDRFWSGIDLNKLYQEASDRNRDVRGLESIFEAGFTEFGRLREKRGVDSRTQLEGAQRAMRAHAAREIDDLEHNLEFLASVGSISPYVGLFGTVWGIMISFQSLASMKEATIATVAPGISEALIATAMGLFAAIPAVWAYNRFATKVERISVRYEAFAEEFSSILQRQAHLD
ncbi:MAG: protein TolQ [Xanthomonadaceae bacterium]|nr:protein TolQ [Xanthomonadaceae bacterium]